MPCRSFAISLLTAALLLATTAAQAQKKPKGARTATPALEQGSTTAEGKRVGKWNFYDDKQQLELSFDYDSSRIGFLREDTTRYLVRIDEQWQPRRLNRAPRLLGSSAQRLQDLGRQLRYPAEALRQQLQGTAVLGYTINPDGHTSDYTVESSMSPECDQEVWRVLRAVPDNWLPAVYRGRPTATRFYLAVKFRIVDETEMRRENVVRKGFTDLLAGTVPPTPPKRPGYVQEIIVTAMGIELGVRTEQMGR